MTEVNGHGPKHEPQGPEPAALAIARAVWTANMDEDDLPFDDLAEGAREHLIDWAESYIAGHIAWLKESGYRLLPPGAVARPQNDQEAEAMKQALRLYAEAKSRKGGLLMGEKKLILPPGSKLQ